MKKTNFITLLILGITVVLVVALASWRSIEKDIDKPMESTYENSNDLETNSTTPTSSIQEDISSNETGTEMENSNISNIQPASMSDALFIGDSRTVGIMEYAGLTEANYFCDVGMNVFKIKKECVSVPAVGKVTLDELLSNKKYGKIYVMLGINEIGYPFQSVIDKYSDLIEYIEVKQPDATIFIHANLHVSKKRSDSDSSVNNKAINKLNLELSKFANNKNIFYMDANCLFDDKDGNLSADKTSDNVHLYAKYYVEWGEWICKETAKNLRRTALD